MKRMKKMQLRLPWARGPTNNPDEENDETNENRNDILQEIEAYGDQIASKLDGQVRIGFQNINGITTLSRGVQVKITCTTQVN